MQIEVILQGSKIAVIECIHSAGGTQRGRAHPEQGDREAFTEELAFDLGFEGCIGVCRVDKGRTGTLYRKESQRHRDLRGHTGVW